MGKNQGVVYLIHFQRPLSHARHYIGFTKDKNVDARLDSHRRGQGARILAVCNSLGIRWHVARVWFRASRHFERRLKNRGEATLLCPVCNCNAMRLAAVANNKPTAKATAKKLQSGLDSGARI